MVTQPSTALNPLGQPITALCVGMVLGLAWHVAIARDVPTPPWELVGTFEGRTILMDPSTMRRSGSHVQVWTLTELKEPNATARGRAYRSKKALLEMDCNGRSMKVLQDTWYPRPMAEGEPVFQTEGGPSAAYPIQGQSPSEMLWKAACGRR